MDCSAFFYSLPPGSMPFTMGQAKARAAAATANTPPMTSHFLLPEGAGL